ncbi:BnaAnng21330D [Brassica napus]|uniref:BnaAnng21330D protein n=1 Tax=Brassica napus TaxID=3708 RepID=A0A078JJG1_BRANA|nr:BnaAnng21330D [Brassica napus]
MDSDMVEIAPPAFAWCSKTLEIHKEGGCDTLSEGVYVKYKSNLGFDDQPAAQAITSQTMGCNLQTEVWKLILLRLDPVCNLFSSWLQLLSWLRQGSAAAPKTMRTVVAQAAIFSSMASTQQTQQRSSQPRVNKGHKFV